MQKETMETVIEPGSRSQPIIGAAKSSVPPKGEELTPLMLDKVEKKPIRLVGISLSGFSDSGDRQLTIDDIGGFRDAGRKNRLDGAMLELQRKYGGEIIKTADEMIAEKRLGDTDQ